VSLAHERAKAHGRVGAGVVVRGRADTRLLLAGQRTRRRRRPAALAHARSRVMPFKSLKSN